jgi:hypothetical protein
MLWKMSERFLQGNQLAPCHPHQKTASHCSQQSLVADESAAAANHPPDSAFPHMIASLGGVMVFSSPPVTH